MSNEPLQDIAGIAPCRLLSALTRPALLPEIRVIMTLTVKIVAQVKNMSRIVFKILKKQPLLGSLWASWERLTPSPKTHILEE
jgi:hypothetical protein